LKERSAKKQAAPKRADFVSKKATVAEEVKGVSQMSREQDYISQVRDSNKKIWDGINELIAAQREYNALDYGNTLDDGEGSNDGITKTEVGAVVFDTANALVAVLTAGHATNMAKLL
jgi:hypothetical protein